MKFAKIIYQGTRRSYEFNNYSDYIDWCYRIAPEERKPLFSFNFTEMVDGERKLETEFNLPYRSMEGIILVCKSYSMARRRLRNPEFRRLVTSGAGFSLIVKPYNQSNTLMVAPPELN